MVSPFDALGQMVGMLAIVALGYVVGKLGYLDGHTIKHISRLIIEVAMPCLVVASATGLDRTAASVEVPWSFGIAAFLWFSLLGTSWLCNALLRTPKEKRGLYLFAGTCTNTSFLGIPICLAILGQRCAVGASIIDMLTSVFNFTIGFAILARGSSTGKRKSARDVLKQPVVYSCFIAIIMFFTGWELPQGIQTTLSHVGQITSPLAMLVVGALVAQEDLRSVFSDWRSYPFAIIRQLVVTIVLYLLLRAIVPEPMLAELFAIMFALPTGAIVPTFADMCGADVKLATKNTVVSTLLSFLIVPVVVALLGVL